MWEEVKWDNATDIPRALRLAAEGVVADLAALQRLHFDLHSATIDTKVTLAMAAAAFGRVALGNEYTFPSSPPHHQHQHHHHTYTP